VRLDPGKKTQDITGLSNDLNEAAHDHHGGAIAGMMGPALFGTDLLALSELEYDFMLGVHDGDAYNRYVDPTLPLAFSVHSGPGVYAVLVGSGVSRAAGIPTGWEVTLDLISKLAAMSGKANEADADPAAWFRGAYGEDPDYSRVVNHLAATPADRQRLLQRYFEPTEEEREEGVKTPTGAHRAIAHLAAKGYVRVIVTTNFDKLMERALEAEGVNPVVVSTPDAAEGAPPVQHADCTIVKVHGDYLDARIKNTPAELALYNPRMDALLDKIFSEYGLIVCGWSADYDLALREAFKRSRTRRYGTYWVHLGNEPGQAARDLISFIGGQPVSTSGAEAFFGELLDRVESLEEYGGPHPLTAPLAVATAKRYLTEDRHRIRLEDLVRGETEQLYAELFVPELYPPGEGADMTETGFSKRVEGYRRRTDVLLATMIAGCYYDGAERTVWSDALERVANPPMIEGRFNKPLFQLRHYPALLLFYGSGIAAMAGERQVTLGNLLYRARVRGLRRDEYPIALSFGTSAFYDAGTMMNDYLQPDKPPQERLRYPYPISEHLHATLREPLRDVLPDDAGYDHRFDQFEYLRGIVHIAQRNQHTPGYAGREGHGPIGRYGPRLERPEVQRALTQVQEGLDDIANSWAGLFSVPVGQIDEARQAYDSFVSEAPWERF
jgi:hypothetical protein